MTLEKIVILDDLFPQPAAAFRVAEFNYYMKHFQNLEIHSTTLLTPDEICPYTKVGKNINQYYKDFPQYKDRIFPYGLHRINKPKLFYTIFLSGTNYFLSVFEEHNCPFIFTLYPGGGMAINNPESDAKLKRVMSSRLFKKVIITQECVKDYVLNKGFCKEDKIEFIYGGPVRSEIYRNVPLITNRSHINLCFVAYKYTPSGRDKGYDTFVELAKMLYGKFNIRFHVVGGFSSEDIPLGEAFPYFTFYGVQGVEFFKEFYHNMDIIISPTRLGEQVLGSFDGFPTGGCVEAALGGVAVFTSDPLNLNTMFEDRKDIVIIDNNVHKISELIKEYILDPNKLKELRESCRNSFYSKFAIDAQMSKRVKLFEEFSKG